MIEKKLLVITYYWPPSGGPAVQRWLSLTDELVKLGWQIWVVTVDEKYATYQMTDTSFVDKINPSIKVYKTKTIEPFNFYKLLFGKKSIPAPGFSNEANPSFVKKFFRFIRGNLFIPDPRKYWKNFASKKAAELIKENNINIIITAGPPHSTHFIGEFLKRKLCVNWICDFHDLWTDVIYYKLLYHLPFVKKSDQKKEIQILESCDKIFTVGEKYKEKLLSKTKNISPGKIHLIRIGFNDEILQTTLINNQNKFIISYIGSIADYYYPEIFFNALFIAKQNIKINLLVRFVGVVSPVISDLIKKYQLEDCVEFTGYVQHKKAISFLMQSTVLLLINPVTENESMIIPGKIYEYLAANKPIINITKKNSETAGIIAQCNAGKTFARHETQALANYLIDLFTEWKKNNFIVHNADINEVKKFSRSAIALDLSNELLQP
ncbi:MAG: glycosyltransferase [Chitinophagaceae bacterium]